MGCHITYYSRGGLHVVRDVEVEVVDSEGVCKDHLPIPWGTVVVITLSQPPLPLVPPHQDEQVVRIAESLSVGL